MKSREGIRVVSTRVGRVDQLRPFVAVSAAVITSSGQMGRLVFVTIIVGGPRFNTHIRVRLLYGGSVVLRKRGSLEKGVSIY